MEEGEEEEVLLAASDFAEDATAATNPRLAAARAESHDRRMLGIARRKLATGALLLLLPHTAFFF